MTCISPVFVRKVGQFVPCGKCGFCIKKAIEAWCLRIYHEIEYSSSAYFLTLTYDEEHLPLDRQLNKSHLQDFFRSLRKKNPGIRYFAVGEYGTEKGRPHYHAVVFNLVDLDLVTKTWFHGFVTGSQAYMGRIRYMVSYMALPAQECTEPIKPFRIMSRRPGIGAGYLTEKKKDITDENKTPSSTSST